MARVWTGCAVSCLKVGLPASEYKVVRLMTALRIKKIEQVHMAGKDRNEEKNTGYDLEKDLERDLEKRLENDQKTTRKYA